MSRNATWLGLLFGAAALLLGACRTPAPPSPAAVMGRGAEALVATLERELRARRMPQVAQLMTRRCQQLPGVRPVKVAIGAYPGATWMPDAREGALLMGLARLVLSYRAIHHLRLVPRGLRVLPDEVRLRAALELRGVHGTDTLRQDHGVVDLVLVRQAGAWRVDHLRLSRLYSVWRNEPSPRRASQGGGAGSARPPQRAPMDWSVPGRQAPPLALALDATGDGQPELLVSARSGLQLRDPAQAAARLSGPRGVDLRGAAVTALVAGDVDGDGRADLLVGRHKGQTRLYLQPMAGTFQVASGLAVPGRVTGAAMVDLDGDQDLDLYLARHAPPGRMPWQAGEADLLAINRGAGRFELRPVAAGDRGWSLAVCAVDLDGDGDQELLVAREFGPSRLWLNLGQGRLTDVARAAGLTAQGPITACAVGDASGDGRLDLLLGGRGSTLDYLAGRPRVARLATPSSMASATLWLNRPRRGQGPGAVRFGLRPVPLPASGWSTSASMLDHDLDGTLDLLLLDSGPSARLRERWRWQASGAVSRRRQPAPLKGVLGAGPATLLLRPTPGWWIPATFVTPLTGRVAATAMLPRHEQGLRLGHAVVQQGHQLTMLDWSAEIRPAKHHSVLLRLRAAPPNTHALGSRVVLQAEGRRQVREVGAGSGMPGGPPGQVHFGVGQAVRAERVWVRWPDGQWQLMEDLPVDRLVTLRQGRNPQWQEPRHEPAAAPAATPPPDPPTVARQDPDLLALPVGRGAGQRPLTCISHQPPTAARDSFAASRPSPSSLLQRTASTPQSASGPRSPKLLRSHTPRYGVGEICRLRTAIKGRAALVLITRRGASGPAWRAACARLRRMIKDSGLAHAELRLEGASPTKRCLDRQAWPVAPTPKLSLGSYRGLLPLLLLVDAQGTVRHLLSGTPNLIRIRAWLRRLKDQ